MGRPRLLTAAQRRLKLFATEFPDILASDGLDFSEQQGVF
jgi:hypothetical protein